MSLPKLAALARTHGVEVMDLFAVMPEWLVWFAAGVAGVVALAALASVLEAAFELDAV